MLDGYGAIAEEVGGDPDFPTLEEAVYARFHGGGYEESYRIIWQRGGIWYEAEDGHCSCNGFGDFIPYAVTKEYVQMQMDHLKGRE